MNSDNGSESLDGFEFAILLDIDDISRVDLLILRNTLDRKTNRISWSSLLKGLLVLFDREDLFITETAGDNSNDITWQESSLLNSTTDDLSHSLDVVDVGNRKSNRKVGMTLGGHNEVIKRLNNGEPNHLKHLLELLLNFIETTLVPVAGVHLVDADNELINTKKEEETSVLTGLTLLNSQLGVSLSNGSLETPMLSRHEKESNISGGRSSDHVLDVIFVARGVNNGAH